MFFSGIFSSHVAFIAMYAGFLYYILQAVTFGIQKSDKIFPAQPKAQEQSVLFSGENIDVVLLRAYQPENFTKDKQESTHIEKTLRIYSFYFLYHFISLYIPYSGGKYLQYFLKAISLRAPPLFSFFSSFK